MERIINVPCSGCNADDPMISSLAESDEICLE
jgi:hypothetical protein